MITILSIAGGIDNVGSRGVKVAGQPGMRWLRSLNAIASKKVTDFTICLASS